MNTSHVDHATRAARLPRGEVLHAQRRPNVVQRRRRLRGQYPHGRDPGSHRGHRAGRRVLERDAPIDELRRDRADRFQALQVRLRMRLGARALDAADHRLEDDVGVELKGVRSGVERRQKRS
eukprot:29054-Pelagococcus_subviridis.AAC.1